MTELGAEVVALRQRRAQRPRIIQTVEEFSRSPIANRMRMVDVFPKAAQYVHERSSIGAVATVITCSLLFWMFAVETWSYVRPSVRDELVVDVDFKERLHFRFNMSFPSLPCPRITLDVLDVTGEQRIALEDDIYKSVITEKSWYSPERVSLQEEEKLSSEDLESSCFSCFGAEEFEGECCNSCEEVIRRYNEKNWALPRMSTFPQCVREQLTEKYGCNIYGSIELRKIPGNIHIAPGHSYEQVVGGQSRHVHNFNYDEAKAFNSSHIIHHLSFGEKMEFESKSFAPLDGVKKTVETGSGMFKYFIKVVPTEFIYTSGVVRTTNQFSCTEKDKYFDLRMFQALPGLYFVFDINPMRVRYVQTSVPFTHYFTRLCAIIGGVFIVSGWLQRSVSWLDKKRKFLGILTEVNM